MVGLLSLQYSTPEEAIKSAKSIAEKGKGKVQHVKAVYLSNDDKLTTLWS